MTIEKAKIQMELSKELITFSMKYADKLGPCDLIECFSFLMLAMTYNSIKDKALFKETVIEMIDIYIHIYLENKKDI